jgi:hypothetical protein
MLNFDAQPLILGKIVIDGLRLTKKSTKVNQESLIVIQINPNKPTNYIRL